MRIVLVSGTFRPTMGGETRSVRLPTIFIRGLRYRRSDLHSRGVMRFVESLYRCCVLRGISFNAPIDPQSTPVALLGFIRAVSIPMSSTIGRVNPGRSVGPAELKKTHGSAGRHRSFPVGPRDNPAFRGIYKTYRFVGPRLCGLASELE